MRELRSVTKRYGGQAALDGISLSVAEGAYLSPRGPSGSGTSTLLRVLAGFEAPDEGQGTLDGRADRDACAWVPPRLCPLDGPLGALDANLRQRMTAELRRSPAALGTTCCQVTGNEMEAGHGGSRRRA